jgi:hypothetical protein
MRCSIVGFLNPTIEKLIDRACANRVVGQLLFTNKKVVRINIDIIKLSAYLASHLAFAINLCRKKLLRSKHPHL